MPKQELQVLLKNLRPELQPGEYAFCKVARGAEQLAHVQDAICMFKEQEDTTFVLPLLRAKALALPFEFVAAWIVLTVESDLATVGLTAIFSKALSDAGISSNVVAAFHHDHIFVPAADATRAVRVLQELSQQYQQ